MARTAFARVSARSSKVNILGSDDPGSGVCCTHRVDTFSFLCFLFRVYSSLVRPLGARLLCSAVCVWGLFRHSQLFAFKGACAWTKDVSFAFSFFFFHTVWLPLPEGHPFCPHCFIVAYKSLFPFVSSGPAHVVSVFVHSSSIVIRFSLETKKLTLVAYDSLFPSLAHDPGVLSSTAN